MENKSEPRDPDSIEITKENMTGSTGKLNSTTQSGGIIDKKDKNAGSGAFNQGSEQDPDLHRGVSDETPDPEHNSREKQNPKTLLKDSEV